MLGEFEWVQTLTTLPLDRLEATGLPKPGWAKRRRKAGGRAERMASVTTKGVHAWTVFYNAVTRESRSVSWEAL
jgi:hypothetical protein